MKETKTSSSDKGRIFVFIAMLAAAAYISFIPALKDGFVNWDDNKYVTENPYIREFSLKNTEKIFTSFYVGNYHPLTLLAYSAEYRFFKFNPLAYHVSSLALHIANCLLFFWLIYLLSGEIFLSFVAGILFAVHPLRVESVAWVSEKKDVLSAFFFLVASVSYLYYCRKGARGHYFLAVAMFLLSLLSKAMMMTFPFILVIYDLMLGRKIDRKSLLEKLPFLAISLVFAVTAVIAQKQSGSVYENTTLPLRLLVASHGVLFYLYKTIAPLGLSCLYPYPDKIPLLFKVSPLLMVFLFGFVFYAGKRFSEIKWGFLLYLVAVFPVLQLLPVGRAIAADRYSYIPSMGIMFALASVVFRLYDRNKSIRKLFVALLFAAVVFLSALTQQRCSAWKDGLTLWTDFIDKYKTYPLGYNNRGNEYRRIKEYDKAISDYSNAVLYAPNFTEAYYNRGVSFADTGEYDRAILDFNKALSLNPGLPLAWLNLGLAYMGKNQFDTALSCYSRAIELNPGYYEAYFNRAFAYVRKNLFDEAFADYTKTISINPRFAPAYNFRGNVYFVKKKYELAVADYSAAIKIQPDFADCYHNRAVAYLALGMRDKAAEDARKLQSLGDGGTLAP